ncbi:3,4-dihydroxy-2-butanone-4-phosphate synthase [Pseudonocardia sp. CA-107938]|uniref:3,4-dihydroxy-2-butanone-4-phosphate synthase n=1 Tax=Pseudonocardia sp. CA-107938 TaxID=3240021 RepID=UPI003D929480
MTAVLPTASVRSAESRVDAAVRAIAAGRAVVVADDEDRENEGDLVFAAEHASPALMAFTVRHTSGFVCVALPEEECVRLELPAMARSNQDRFATAYRVTVDAVGCGTGISAADRALTVARLGDRSAGATDFVRPGHVVPLAARRGGVLERRGHTEAAVDLAALAGCSPAGALCEIVSRDHPGTMAHGGELRRFADEHAIPFVTIADLAAVRGRGAPVRRGAATALPTPHGTFRAIGYAGDDGAEHIALQMGRLRSGSPALVHVECLSGNVLRSSGCTCGAELDAALAEVARRGHGVVVYLRPTAARACAFVGPAVLDSTTGHAAAAILADLGVGSSTGIAEARIS